MLSLSGELVSQFPTFGDRLIRTWLRIRAKSMTFFVLASVVVALGIVMSTSVKTIVFTFLLAPQRITLMQKIIAPFFLLGIAYLMNIFFVAIGVVAGFKTSLRQACMIGVERSHTLLWIGVISSFAVTAASVAFIVPGILLALALAMTLPVLVVERQRGFSALTRSRQLMVGHVWHWFLHWTALSLCFGIPSFVILTSLTVIGLPYAWLWVTIASIVIKIIVIPCMIVFTQLFYEDIMLEKKVRAPNTPSHRHLYIFLSVLGALFAAGAIVALLLFQNNFLQNKIFSLPITQTVTGQIIDLPRPQFTAAQRDVIRYQDVVVLRLALATYFVREKRFPQTLAAMVPIDLTKIPSDPTTGLPYLYTPSGDSYTLLFALESGVANLTSGTHTATIDGIDPPATTP